MMHLGRLGALSVGRNNNFNLLRMCSATGVMVSHCLPLAYGHDQPEPFVTALDGLSMSWTSVFIFFVVSGFFVTQSMDRAATIGDFIRARVFRIVPALFVVLVVTVLVSGMFLTTAAPAVFWTAAPEYILRNLTLVSLKYELPGVFLDNPYPERINSPLWTLVYEVTCYIGVFLLGLCGVLRKPRLMALVFALFVVAYFIIQNVPTHPRLFFLSLFGVPFAIGALFYVWRDRVLINGWIALALIVAAIVLRLSPVSDELFRPAFSLALSYAVFFIGYLPWKTLRAYNRFGDYSYGTYIYGWPCQQLVVWLGIVTPLGNLVAGFLLAVSCAALSWRFVEKPALRFKRPRPPAQPAGNT